VDEYCGGDPANPLTGAERPKTEHNYNQELQQPKQPFTTTTTYAQTKSNETTAWFRGLITSSHQEMYWIYCTVTRDPHCAIFVNSFFHLFLQFQTTQNSTLQYCSL